MTGDRPHGQRSCRGYRAFRNSRSRRANPLSRRAR